MSAVIAAGVLLGGLIAFGGIGEIMIFFTAPKCCGRRTRPFLPAGTVYQTWMCKKCGHKLETRIRDGEVTRVWN